MEYFKNIYNHDILKQKINYIAVFTLIFESFKDFIITQPRDFLCLMGIKDGKLNYIESPEYKKLRSLDKRHLDNASFKWFIELNAFSEEDFAIYNDSRKKRNRIVHEMISEVGEKVTEEDMELLVKMIELYRKIDKWWINEIEIQISTDEISGNYDSNDIFSIQDMILESIVDIAIGDGKMYSRISSLFNQQNK
ncbi:hypothetical protein [Peptostreptococcus porci]|uniref:hypothetical protein n=1 Tax=Peptostreptococcus porci TaxID=2652282 RepID=UPI002A83A37C|nr:hypothetical protein [Peptostreptococcus porci]MDY4128277.1 hypothetical protein [Peptostreptococcus porci]